MKFLFSGLVVFWTTFAAWGQTLENASLKVVFRPENGAFDVQDKRTGRNWKALPDTLPVLAVSGVKAEENRLMFTFRYPQINADFHAVLTLEQNALGVRLDAAPESRVGTRLEYPYPFEAAKGERVLLPHGCGFAFPVEMADVGTDRLDLFGVYGRDMNMGVWGQYAETVSEDGEILPACGYMAILETPENAAIRFAVRKNGLRQINICWTQDKQTFGYARSIRYVFMEKCNPVSIAARYREIMRAKGYLVTFEEKKKRSPKLAGRLDTLIGAPNVWYWDADKEAALTRLKELGFDNVLMNCAGGAETFQNRRSSPEQVRNLARFPNVLVSCYDIYKDLIEPEKLSEVRYVSSDWIPEAWTNDDIVRRPDGTPARGWQVFPKDPEKPMIPCASLCEARACDYARKRIGKILETSPYSARFLDVTGCGLGECWNPKHPLNRRESLVARQKLFFMLGEAFHLVCGTEDGVECFVPCCDYFEGMFSAPNHYRVDGGRWQTKIYDEVPEKIRLGTSEQLRVPFWELVFHDCVVSYWYWCDYNNKFPAIWWKRDLFNAVCGTPPMYLFDKATFTQIQPQLAESVKIAAPVSRMTGMSPMTNYRWLTPDRKVQQSEFGNGVRVTVHFGDVPYRMTDGFVLEPRGVRVEKNGVSVSR
ncbi:MAG: glycoside hydrolase [Planctomycetia bacterium]|nr:glycoside hydrolase [Planctomycetia bacterium]